ncbi:MAG: T9SS type A sorting domain-containing protein [Bacteroidales bacterium]|nr:T9SS type A sorting domain-containing protein [Bacteroidales bacterium]
MKNPFRLTILLWISLFTLSQASLAQDNDRYCRQYPEFADIASSFAYRNDWQSDLVHNYDVKFYWLDLNVTSASVDVSGKVTIHADVVADNFTVFAFELVPDLTITSVIFNGQVFTSWDRDGDNVLLTVPELNTGDTFIAEIVYGGTPPSGGFFAGITNDYTANWDKHMTWTLSEPFNAKQWWPCKQVLTDKADSVWVFLTTAATNMAGSQGLLTNTVDVGNGMVRYEWKSKIPIDYYLISFSVSDYQEYNIWAKPAALNGDSILVQNYLFNSPGYLQQYQNDINQTVPMIELYSELFTLYPFPDEKYGHCITTLGGGMEHQTMTTLGGWSFNLVAHELGHMWFGDNVTCATWSDIWVNEGFATYTNYLAQEKLRGWAAGQSFMVNTQTNVMSAPNGSVYVPESEATPDNVWRIFNGRLSYDKGAAIIHLLRHEINDDTVFFEVLQTYQDTYGDSTATGDDFRAIAESVTGMDLGYFFDQWYYGEGYPIYDIVWYMNGGDLVIINSQSTSTSITPLFKTTLDFLLTYTDSTKDTIRVFQDANLNTFTIPVAKVVESIAVDPANWTFEKVNSIVVGVQDIENPNYFSVSPNPATNNARIALLNKDNTTHLVQLIAPSGKVILEQMTSGAVSDLSLSGIPSGLYFVRLSNGAQQFMQKLVKL